MLRFDRVKPQTFDFMVGDEKFSLPAFRSLPPSTLRDIAGKLAGGAESQEARMLFTEVVLDLLDAHAPRLLDELSLDQLGELVGAWLADGGDGETPGESSASSD